MKSNKYEKAFIGKHNNHLAYIYLPKYKSVRSYNKQALKLGLNFKDVRKSFYDFY